MAAAEHYAGLARSEVFTCQAMIEKLRHDGYAVVGLAAGAQPRLSDQFRLTGGNADTGMVLDFVVTATAAAAVVVITGVLRRPRRGDA